MVRLFLVTAFLLTPVLLALTPVAGAHHTCQDLVRVEAAGYDAGVYGFACVGFDASVVPVKCERVIWGYHADAYGAGGLRNCEAGAYVHWWQILNGALP